jgi:hypothetical protein
MIYPSYLGAGEAYAYVPTTDEICKEKQVICNSDYGTSISRGVIRFNTQNWTRIEIYMKLNTGSNQDGVLEVWQDESLRINRRDMLYRTTDAMGISNMMFSTFFGGGTPDYASPVDTYAYFKNIQYSTGNPTKPTEGRATILAPSATIVACLVLSIAFSLL